jgi:ubiquinone/menaquinone biosynthesis C-methylase UbiE
MAINVSTAQHQDFDLDLVELANAHGPYSHGSWLGEHVKLGNEEALAGRGALLADSIRRLILSKFSIDEIRQMTCLDVGCYDGWLLCQLEDLPFKRLIGVEPRNKNIEKGRIARQIVGISTRCEFRVGSIDNIKTTLTDEQVDVVICTGLFHHLSSIPAGVESLRSVCKRLLFVETLCLPSSFENEEVKKALELKDIPYFFTEQKFGLTGHKLESGYYDGSAVSPSVVSVPTIGALQMFFEVGGFKDFTIEVNPFVYRKSVTGGYRDFNAVCISAVPKNDAISFAGFIDQYESGLIETVLPRDLIEYLTNKFLFNEEFQPKSALHALIEQYLLANQSTASVILQQIQPIISNSFVFEIIKNFRFSPHDKLAIEYGKLLITTGDIPTAERTLLGVTRKLNADWRSVYRAFCLLSVLYRRINRAENSEKYKTLCLLSNSQFPQRLLHHDPTFQVIEI